VQSGDPLIDRHDERSSGSAGHEEVYLVLRGAAAFTVDGDEIDAPAGSAIEIASEGLAHWPEHPLLHDQLACYNAVAGHRAQAVAQLRIAWRGDARTRARAAEDADLATIRDDPALG
jgi:hypothetical protein